ncbi:PD-(D/E)XK nuclease family protein [Sphingomonas floccifaciens]|uniref:PD-(D/E)XK nuclease family protein n=1 Tax=Sphingomonas floccifaciens TaxID=1844115 RepID=A0ABW4NC45_9SPHN
MAKALDILRPTLIRLAHQYPRLSAKREGAEMFGAPRLNSFMLFQPNEVTLSRVIADLFDPAGSHGQDTLFLNNLLSALDLPRVGVTDPVSVRREMVTRAGRQIDLVIEIPGLILGIENKPWATQQHNQLADYLSALQLWSRGRKPVLIFLSNKKPETAKDDVRIVHLYSDEDDEVSLHGVLSDSRDQIRAQRTSTHIHEMLDYLALEFGDTPMIEKSDLPFVEAVTGEYERDADGRRALAMTMLAGESLHERITTEISERLVAALKKEFPDVTEQYDDWSLYDAIGEKHNCWSVRRSSWPENCAIGIAAERTNFDQIYFGVRAPEKKKGTVDEDDVCALRKPISAAVKNVEGGRSDAWWPWWKTADPASWGPQAMASLILQSPTGQVADHPRFVELAQKMLALMRAVDEAVSDS